MGVPGSGERAFGPGLSLSKQSLHSSTKLPRDPAIALALQRGVWEPSLLGTVFVAVLPWDVQGLGGGQEGMTPCLCLVPCLTLFHVVRGESLGMPVWVCLAC